MTPFCVPALPVMAEQNPCHHFTGSENIERAVDFQQIDPRLWGTGKMHGAVVIEIMSRQHFRSNLPYTFFLTHSGADKVIVRCTETAVHRDGQARGNRFHHHIMIEGENPKRLRSPPKSTRNTVMSAIDADGGIRCCLPVDNKADDKQDRPARE